MTPAIWQFIACILFSGLGVFIYSKTADTMLRALGIILIIAGAVGAGYLLYHSFF